MWLVVQEAAGRARGEVEAELYERYGDVLRPAPKARGFGLTAYLIPIATFGGGGLLLFVFLRRQTRKAPAEGAETSEPTELDPELARIVDREIAG
jgi:cytochrome c-type biogenesis protein CcmH/NrfF